MWGEGGERGGGYPCMGGCCDSPFKEHTWEACPFPPFGQAHPDLPSPLGSQAFLTASPHRGGTQILRRVTCAAQSPSTTHHPHTTPPPLVASPSPPPPPLASQLPPFLQTSDSHFTIPPPPIYSPALPPPNPPLFPRKSPPPPLPAPTWQVHKHSCR